MKGFRVNRSSLGRSKGPNAAVSMGQSRLWGLSTSVGSFG